MNTEKTYLGWLRQFQAYLGAKPPRELTFDDMRRYLSHLAVAENGDGARIFQTCAPL
jgi:hypothetical protein